MGTPIMMPNHISLASLFGDIANAIRAKTGGLVPIVADDFPDAISAIPTGGGTPRTSADLTVSGDTVTAPAGVYASDANKSVASGTEGTPSAAKGAVSNHAIAVTPSVTNTEGYIQGGTHDGSPVTVQASELVSGKKEITANGDDIDVTNFQLVKVAVPTGSSKNVQAYIGYASRKANSYGATSVTLTVKKAGTYKISWCAWRSSSSGTMGTNLHIGNQAGSNQETWTGTYGQCVTLTDQSLNANDVLTLYATSGSTSRTVYVGNLIIEEQ